MDWLKRNLGSGLVILLPILVSVFALRWLYTKLAALPLVEGIQPPAVGVVLSIALFVTWVFGIGYLMRTALGTVLAMRLDALMNRVPGIRVVYNASKMAIETVVADTDGLKRPVKLKPWGDLRVTGFDTGHESDEGNPVIFIPTSPNVTSGIVVEVDEEDVIELDESVEDALTRVLSAGFGEKNGQTNVPGNVFSPSDDE
ncbi:DUF502 domain-containing protein [Natronoarchaeum mannanilyticum]|uniref:DUF502 domain-containing protein n=1 Tax=Natronoarchaeum mannanilyticum TaxID=926360 RepID=A0AAV3TBW7_9EURY